MTETQIVIAYIFYAFAQSILFFRWNNAIEKDTASVIIAAVVAPVMSFALLCDFINWLIGVAVGRNE